MAVGRASRYRVAPGRREDFINLVRGVRDALQPLGASVVLRNVQSGGENSGHVTMLIAYDDAGAQAAASDRSRAEGLLAPLVAKMQGADSPAELVSRVSINEVGGPGPLGEQRTFQAGIGFMPAPGRRDEALEALEGMRQRWSSVGVEARLWGLSFAGPLTSAVLLGHQHESMTALAEAQQAFQALDTPRPGREALRAGHMTVTGSALSVLVDL